MMRPDISSISSTSVRQSQDIAPSSGISIPTDVAMGNVPPDGNVILEHGPYLLTCCFKVMLPLSVTSTLLTDEGRPPFPELGTEKVPGVLRGAEAQVGMPTTGREDHDYSIYHRVVWLMFYFVISHSSRPSDGSTNPGNNLHVANLNRKMDNNGLEAIFAKVGRVCSTVLCANLTLTRSLGPKSIHYV